MPENQTLSLDLGSNSIGAVIRNLLEENQFEKTSVTTFETGVGKDKENKYTISLAANRTTKRSVRRLYQSRKYKLWAVLKALIKDKDRLFCPIKETSLKRWKFYNKDEAQKGNGGRKYPVEDTAFANWIKMDFNKDSLPDYISPYQLRSELGTIKLDFSIEENRFKLGRALYHIAQHRGFKSSKIVNNKDDSKDEQVDLEQDIIIGAERTKQEKFKKEIEKIGFTFDPETETIGILFAKIENEGIHHPDRKIEGIRIRKNLHQYVTRKMLIKEVKQTFDFQGLDFNSIFGDQERKLSVAHSPIFWQRPLRSQKGLVGYCTLESRKIFDKKKGREVFVGKKRCPVSRPEFEEFRALSFINNIAYREKVGNDKEWHFLSQEMRHELYIEKFFVQKDFEFADIIKWIKRKNKHPNWELNYNPKTNVSACIVSARLKKIFDIKWNSAVVRTDKKENKYNIPFFEDVWHVLFESDDQDFIEDYGKNKLGLEEDKIQQLRSIWFAMPVGYAQLSLKAINNILPFLREGFIYTDAVLLGKVPEILGEKIWKENKKFIAESLKTAVIEKNRSEKRVLNIVNNLIAQYKVLSKKDRYADNDLNYVVGSRDAKLSLDSRERDDNQIVKAAEEGFGKETWKNLSDQEKSTAIKEITDGYQQFFNSHHREFFRLPRLGDAMKKFLADNFPDLLYCPETFKKVEKAEDKCHCEKCKSLNKLYHPSMIAIYPQAKEEFYKYDAIQKKMVMLGSPKTGAFKNPMAMRTLHELKKLVNYCIATGQINEETRVVVEVSRELNDTNKRWAIEKYQEIRRKENEEFAIAIRELLNDPEEKGSLADADSDNDIDKFRLWYEMIESIEGFDKSGKFTSIEDDRTKKEKKGRKKKKHNETESMEEDEFYEFSENHFENIKKEVWVKLKKAKDSIIEKYRLWKEQQCFCIYTGNPIRISDLFKENIIDIEHTIPRSISFDNSLANKTVCFADYNRNTKKNQIPTKLPNYYEIEQRIENWKQKVKDLEMRVEFWKGKSKQASTPEYKNKAIREKHLWQFELDYWKNKLERFTITEVKPGFKNSQLKDTQLISKYAMHYLKSYFSRVDVEKGEVTSEFRKIFDIQETGTKKDRSKHSHHAKDAIVLSIIPPAAIRDKMLEVWYKIKEKNQLLQSDTGKDKSPITEEIKQLEDELQQLKFQCNVPKGLNNTIRKLDEEILNNNIARNRSVIPAGKKVRFKGKDFVAKGDAIRGELHLATMYGKIQMVERDKDDKPLRDENGNWKFKQGKDAFKFGIRKEVDKNLDIDKIVDPTLKKIIKDQIGQRTLAATLSEDGGLYMLKNDGKTRVHKIRHIRCFADDVSNPVQVKMQTITGNKEHKNYYWAKNGENIICLLYQKIIKNKKGNVSFDRELEIITLMDVAALVRAGEIKSIDELDIYRKDKKTGQVIINESGDKETPYAILKPGMKVIFFDETLDELKKQKVESEGEHKKRISYRTYVIVKFTGGRLTFQHHLESRSDPKLKVAYPEKMLFKQDENGKDISYGGRGTSGFTETVTDALKHNRLNNFEPWPRLLYSVDWLNMATEGKHFEVMPDGEIKWK